MLQTLSICHNQHVRTFSESHELYHLHNQLYHLSHHKIYYLHIKDSTIYLSQTGWFYYQHESRDSCWYTCWWYAVCVCSDIYINVCIHIHICMRTHTYIHRCIYSWHTCWYVCTVINPLLLVSAFFGCARAIAPSAHWSLPALEIFSVPLGAEGYSQNWATMMIAFITFNSSLVPLFEGDVDDCFYYFQK